MSKKKKRTQSLTAFFLIWGMTALLMCGLAGCSGTDISDIPSESDGQQSENATDGKQEESSGQGTEPTDRPGAVVGTKLLVDAQFDEAYPYSEGFAIVGQDTGSGMKYNYIDLDGNYLLQEWVDIAYSFSDGMACVGTMVEPEIDDYNSEQLYLFGYVDTTGQMAVKAEYIGSKSYHPLCFYQGYAEVQYYIINEKYAPYYHTYCNVIDRQGNRLFDFDAELYDDFEYGGGFYDYRLLTLKWHGLGWSDYCYYNQWMRNYVNCNYYDYPQRNSILEDGTTSYLVSPDGSVIYTVPGSAIEIGDGFYSVSNYNEDGTESAALYDAEWNLVREGDYRTFGSNWFVELIPITGENSWRNYWCRIWDRDFQPVTGELYRQITELHENQEIIGYIVQNEQMVWRYLDKDFHEVFTFEGEYDNVSPLTYHYSIGNSYMTTLYSDGSTLYSGKKFDIKSAASTTALLNEQGRILRTTTLRMSMTGSVSYRTINSEVLLEYISGQSIILIDYAGNDLIEIPLIAFINSNSIESTEDTIQIAGYTTSSGDQSDRTYYVIDIAKTNGQWEIQEIQEISYEDYCNYTGVSLADDADEEVLMKNDESRILGVFLDGYSEDAEPVRLEDASGKVLEPAQTALSLVEDNLYLVAGKIQPIEESWEYEAVEMYLQNAEQTLSIEVFEKLGLLSEDRIAFRENGKWGYLKLVRETP